MNSFSLAKRLRLSLAITYLIRIISTVIVPITAETSRDTVPIGTGKILMITGHWFCIEQEANRKAQIMQKRL